MVEFNEIEIEGAAAYNDWLLDFSNEISDKIEKDYKELAEHLKSLGLRLHFIKKDGNCLFRSVSELLYGSGSEYRLVREKVADAMEKWKHILQPWATLDDDGWKNRVKCMREDKSWGATLELVSVSLAYKVGIRQ